MTISAMPSPETSPRARAVPVKSFWSTPVISAWWSNPRNRSPPRARTYAGSAATAARQSTGPSRRSAVKVISSPATRSSKRGGTYPGRSIRHACESVVLASLFSANRFPTPHSVQIDEAQPTSPYDERNLMAEGVIADGQRDGHLQLVEEAQIQLSGPQAQQVVGRSHLPEQGGRDAGFRGTKLREGRCRALLERARRQVEVREHRRARLHREAKILERRI